MKIIDINGKERECDSFRIIQQQDSAGFSQKYVKCTIVSLMRGTTWDEFYPYGDFLSKNPDMEQDMLSMELLQLQKKIK